MVNFPLERFVELRLVGQDLRPEISWKLFPTTVEE